MKSVQTLHIQFVLHIIFVQTHIFHIVPGPIVWIQIQKIQQRIFGRGEQQATAIQKRFKEAVEYEKSLGIKVPQNQNKQPNMGCLFMEIYGSIPERKNRQ